jgi:hypothetical protein
MDAGAVVRTTAEFRCGCAHSGRDLRIVMATRVIPSASRGIPQCYLEACAAGFLDCARNDGQTR